ncbi:MAG: PAS domain S-box protein, partial [Ktedonobacterales bacterium]
MTTTRESKLVPRPASASHATDGEVPKAKLAQSTILRSGRKRTASEDRFAALAQATGQMVWTVLPDGSVIDAPPWRTFTGLTAEQIKGWGWLDAVHPSDRERTAHLWEQAVASQTPFEGEYRARRNDGMYRLVGVRAMPIWNASGRVREWVSVSTDITERRQLEDVVAEHQRMEDALQKHERTLLESVSDGFLAVDKTGLLTYVNASVERVLGKGREELVGHNVRELFPEVLAVPFYREYERVLAEGTPATFEAFYPPLARWFETRLYPAPDGVTAYLNDSTARRQMEEQLAQSLAREQAAHVEAERRRDEAEVARIEAETASQRLLQLQEVTDTALSHLALADLVPAVLDRICGVMAVESAAILLLTEDGQELTVYAGRGALEDHSVRIPLGQGVAGRIAASRQPLIVDDLSAIEVVSSTLYEQLRAVAGVPLLVEGRRIGVLQVGSAVVRQFAEPDIRLLQLVGDRIALAIEHGQLYELARAGYIEAEARASELAATFATMTDGVFVTDRQGRRVQSNQAFRQLLGLDPRPDADEIPPPERSVFLDVRDAQDQPVPPERLPTARIIRGEILQGPTAMDLTMRTKDGRTVEANVTGAPVRTTEGGIIGAVAVYRDVTKRRQLERKVIEQASQLEGVFDAMADA